MLAQIGVIAQAAACMSVIEGAKMAREREIATVDYARSMMEPEAFNQWMDDRAIAKEKARLEEVEERRHREVCEAIKASKPEPVGLGKILFGALCIGSIID